MNNFQHIIELIRKGDVILFVGAGFSIDAGAPKGKELCDMIYQALPDRIKKAETVKTVSAFLVRVSRFELEAS